MIVEYFAVIALGVQVGGELPLVRLAEPPAEHVLLIERLHDADTGHAFLERVSVPPTSLAQLQVRAVRLPPEPARRL